MIGEKLTAEQLGVISEACAHGGRSADDLVNVLYRIQKKLGYLPESVQKAVAQEMEIPLREVSEVVASYSMFLETPVGEHPIYVCIGRSCASRGAGAVLAEFERQLGIKVGEVTEDGKFSLDTFSCVGACGQAPVVIVSGKLLGHMTPDKVAEVIAGFR